MPFTTTDKFEIKRILRINSICPRKDAEIQMLLNKIQEESEVVVKSIQNLIEQAKITEAELFKASQGMVKADVLEWSPDRNCKLNQYLSKIRRELAISIGYYYPLSVPFQTVGLYPDNVYQGEYTGNYFSGFSL